MSRQWLSIVGLVVAGSLIASGSALRNEVAAAGAGVGVGVAVPAAAACAVLRAAATAVAAGAAAAATTVATMATEAIIPGMATGTVATVSGSASEFMTGLMIITMAGITTPITRPTAARMIRRSMRVTVRLLRVLPHRIIRPRILRPLGQLRRRRALG